MNRIGECAVCGNDIMLVNFDDKNGCRFCIGCGRRGPDAITIDEEPTVVDLDVSDITQISPPPPALLAIARKDTRS